MKRIITLLLPFLVLACATEKKEPKEIYQPPQLYDEYVSEVVDEIPIAEASYKIKFQMDKVKGNDYNLLVGMELGEGNQFLSPYTSDKFTGRFKISIEDNVYLIMDSTFIEMPQSVEELDMHPFIRGLVNRVRVNTTYQHAVKVISKDDFEVSGLVSFTIEPGCTFEEIEFIISQKSGKIQIKKKSNA